MVEDIVINSHVLDGLKILPDESVDCVITSPPYWGLRDYGDDVKTIWGGDDKCEHEWGVEGEIKIIGGKKTKTIQTINSSRSLCSKCGAWLGQLGHETTFEMYIDHLIEVFAEVKRVLKKTGTCFVNLGDSYLGSQQGYGASKPSSSGFQKPCTLDEKYCSKPPTMLYPKQAKSLAGVPERFAIAMTDKLGFIRRNTIIWHKPNCMPQSCKDRFTVDFEYVFFFTKNKKYYFEQQFEPYQEKMNRWGGEILKADNLSSWDANTGQTTYRTRNMRPNEKGRNKRCVWSINTQPFSGAHFACVDTETEALTISGWKKFNQLKIGELLVAFDMTNERLRYEPLQDFKVYDYEGDMIQIKTLQTDMLLTPNHRVVSRRFNKRKKCLGKYRIVSASDIKERDKIPVIAEWEEGTYGLLPSPSPDLAELIGWVIAEGYIKNHTITIYQSVNNKRYVETIKSLLERCNIKYRYKINHKKYKDEIKETGCFFLNWYSSKHILSYIPNKTFEPYMMLWDKECLQRLFNGFVKGDGHIRGDKRIQVNQKDKKNVDLFQYLCFRLNKRSLISKPRLFSIFITDKKYVTIRSTKGKVNKQTVHYKGKIWCPKLPSGTWVARRNGKIFITGNTFPPDLVEPMIVSGTPVNGIVLDPFFGSGTVGVVAKKFNRHYIGIEMNSEYIKMAERRIRQECGGLFDTATPITDDGLSVLDRRGL